MKLPKEELDSICLELMWVIHDQIRLACFDARNTWDQFVIMRSQERKFTSDFAFGFDRWGLLSLLVVIGRDWILGSV